MHLSQTVIMLVMAWGIPGHDHPLGRIHVSSHKDTTDVQEKVQEVPVVEVAQLVSAWNLKAN